MFTNVPFELEYYIQLPNNLLRKEIIRIGILTLLVKNVTNFTEVIDKITFLIDYKKAILKVKGDANILKSVYSHEIHRIKAMVNRQRMTIIDQDNRRSETLDLRNTNIAFKSMTLLYLKPHWKTFAVQLKFQQDA